MNMILCIGNLMEPTRILLELINKFSKVAWYKINIQKSIIFSYINEQSEIKLRKVLFTIISKKLK